MFSCLFLHKEKESLREELQALKRENKLLKENNALESRKKEHYACEIKRLNKVPEQVKHGGKLIAEAATESCWVTTEWRPQCASFASREDTLSGLHRAPSHSLRLATFG